MDGVPDETWDGRVAYNPPVDAVQEVRVKAFDSDASFGHTGGGTLNQIMKTGTNGLHGSLWEFNQPSDMVANDFFRNRSGQGLQITHFNQYGLTVGGPMVLPKVYNGRNKLFWFFSFEGLKDGQPNPTLLTVPTDAEKQGNFSALLPLGTQYQLYNPNSAVLNGTTVTRSPFPGNIIPQNLLSPIALNYMKFYPEPNVTVGVGATGTNNYSSSATTTDNYSNELGRLDYNLSDKDRMFFDIRTATETQQKNNYFANPAEGSLLYRKPLGDNLRRRVRHQSHHGRRCARELHAPSRNPCTAQHGIRSHLARLPVVYLGRFAISANAHRESLHFPKPGRERREQLSVAIAAVIRRCGQDRRQPHHQVRRRCAPVPHELYCRWQFHRYVFRSRTPGFAPPAAPSSTVAQGQDLASLLLGLPTAGSFDVNSFGSFYNYYAALFVQDDWRVTRNLTVNFGLHYDHDGAVHEKYGRTVDGFDATDSNPIAAAAMANYAKSPISQIPVGAFKVPGGLDFASPSNNAIYQNTSHLVSPRVGFAWSPDSFERHGDSRRFRHVRRPRDHRQPCRYRSLFHDADSSAGRLQPNHLDDGHEQ